MRCTDSGLSCTFLRGQRKSGPRSLRKPSLMRIWEAQMPDGLAIEEVNSLFADAGEPTTAPDQQRISHGLLRTVLLLYKERLYGIWPLLTAEDLIQRLEDETVSPELYSLATALCAATLSNLNQSVAHESLREPLTAESLVNESRRVRATFDYMESVTLNTILTSYFLHIFYGRQTSRSQTATFYIREAITFAHLFGMHIEEMYAHHSVKDQQVMRKLYYLLFMTERYLCIQNGLPTVLESITLPTIEHEDSPEVVAGFLNLVTLFSTPGSDFFGKWTSHSANVSMSSEQLLLIQHALQRPPEITRVSNEIQRVDVVVSQHWIRSLAWKMSILLGYVMPNGRREMNPAYPSEIAQDALRGVSQFSTEAFEVHGPGMEVKLHEIASVLADSILCLPEEHSRLLVSPRDTLKALTGLIFSIHVSNPDLRNALLRKLDTTLGSSSIPAAIDLVDQFGHQATENDEEASSIFALATVL